MEWEKDRAEAKGVERSDRNTKEEREGGREERERGRKEREGGREIDR